MPRCWLILVFVPLLLCGCRTPALETIDQAIADLASRPIDQTPAPELKHVSARPSQENPAPDGAGPDQAPLSADQSADEVVRASYSQIDTDRTGQVMPHPLQKYQLTIPEAVPGSETPLVTLPKSPADRDKAITELYSHLPPLPDEPVPLPGPERRPYSLADLQRMAAENSPSLRQAASDVEAAKGQMQQAALYPNPTTGYESAPNANNTSSATQGFFIDQVIRTGGKIKIQVAVAEMNLKNAELAFRRARFDLATTIRTDYYNLLVAKETVRITKALARFSEEIFRLQTDLLAGGFAASHEPAALRSQAFVVRLAHKQAIATYVMAWKQLVADMGLKQLPLAAVEGQVDRLVPFYDYDAVLAHVLRNHTDIRTARNSLQGARYNLKLTQVTPVPDVDVHFDLYKENNVLPLQHYHQLVIGIPFPIWDRNQGNIRAAAAALTRAAEGPHQAEVALTSGLAAAYATYQNNLAAVEYYRRNILPDQVRYYRGVFERRKVDPSVAFGDLVQAQQTLVTDVTAYLGILGTLWTSVVTVADYLQTEDLYQLGTPLELPQLPDFDAIHPWTCPHPQVTCTPAEGPGNVGPPPDGAEPRLPAPASPVTLNQGVGRSIAAWSAQLRANWRPPGRSDQNRKARVAGTAPSFDATLPENIMQEYLAKTFGIVGAPSAGVTTVEEPPGVAQADASPPQVLPDRSPRDVSPDSLPAAHVAREEPQRSGAASESGVQP